MCTDLCLLLAPCSPGQRLLHVCLPRHSHLRPTRSRGRQRRRQQQQLRGTKAAAASQRASQGCSPRQLQLLHSSWVPPGILATQTLQRRRQGTSLQPSASRRQSWAHGSCGVQSCPTSFSTSMSWRGGPTPSRWAAALHCCCCTVAALRRHSCRTGYAQRSRLPTSRVSLPDRPLVLAPALQTAGCDVTVYHHERSLGIEVRMCQLKWCCSSLPAHSECRLPASSFCCVMGCSLLLRQHLLRQRLWDGLLMVAPLAPASYPLNPLLCRTSCQPGSPAASASELLAWVTGGAV